VNIILNAVQSLFHFFSFSLLKTRVVYRRKRILIIYLLRINNFSICISTIATKTTNKFRTFLVSQPPPPLFFLIHIPLFLNFRSEARVLKNVFMCMFYSKNEREKKTFVLLFCFLYVSFLHNNIKCICKNAYFVLFFFVSFPLYFLFHPIYIKRQTIE
jgi:hypothetical protein